jgi:type IV pilus assembly protein PilM
MDKYKDFMVGFEKGQLIGIDIGLSAVKLAVLSQGKKDSFKLEKFISIPLSEAAIIEDEVQKPDEIIAAIKKAISEGSITKKIACIGMDGPNTVTKRLQVPDGAQDEVEDNILWESEQYIPFGADDAEIGFTILGRIEEEEIVDAIVGAIRTDVAEKYLDFVGNAGLVGKIMDLNVFAVVNMFEYIYDSKIETLSEDGTIILDFGAQYTSIIVYKNNGPVLTKEINLGGVLVTEEIQRSLAVSYPEAEDLKVNGDDQGNLPEEIIDIIESHIEKILDELRKILNFYIAAGSSEQVGHCYITGGSSRLPGLTEALQDLIDIEIQEINPFEVLEVKGKFEDEELAHIASCGLVTLGLAMRSV